MALKQNFGPTVLTKGVSVYLTQVGTRTEIRLKAYFHYFQEKIQKKQTWEQHIALFSKKVIRLKNDHSARFAKNGFAKERLYVFRITKFYCLIVFLVRIFVQRFFLCGYLYKRSRFVKTVEGKNIGASLKHVYLEASILLFIVYQKYVNWMLLIIVVFTCTRGSIGEGGGICFLNCEKRF